MFHVNLPGCSIPQLSTLFMEAVSAALLFRKDTEVDIERHDVDDVFRIVPDEDRGALNHLGEKKTNFIDLLVVYRWCFPFLYEVSLILDF